MRMARFMTTVPLLLGFVALGACGPGDDTYDTEEALETTPPADTALPTTAVERTVMFLPGSAGTAGENVTGTVRVRDSGAAGTTLDIEVMGLPEGEHTVAVVNSPCETAGTSPATDPATGATRDPAAAATPDAAAAPQDTGMDQDRTTIRAGSDGRATGTLTLSGDRFGAGQLNTGQYSVRVFSGSTADVTGTAIVCANLNDQGLGAIR